MSCEAKAKPSWRRANQEEKKAFQDSLEDRLGSVQCPDSVSRCQDTKCQDESHRADLDLFAAEVLEAVQEVAEASLPVPREGRA